MEMLIMFSGGINSTASGLGHLEGDTYIVSDCCADVLEEMLDNLKVENKATRPVRINIANSKVLEGDLLRILSASKDDLEVFQAIVKLLVNLSMPLEVILPMHPNMTKSDWEQRHTLQKMLLQIKKHFVEEFAIQAILEEMNTQLEQHGQYQMDKESKELLNDCLVLIRNVLHIEETAGMDSNTQIVGHMLNNSIGDIVQSMLSREEAEIWICTMVQVIRLMFRNQMSQDLVKRTTKLYKRGTLFKTISEKNSGSESSLPRAEGQKSPSESGSVSDNSGDNTGIDSGFTEAESTVGSSFEKTSLGHGSTEESCSSIQPEKENTTYQTLSPDTKSSYGRMLESPSPKSTSVYDGSPRDSTTDFLSRSFSPAKEDSGSPGRIEKKKENAKQTSSHCSSRTQSPADESPFPSYLVPYFEDDTCSQTSGQGSTISSSSSSSTGSSETGSSVSSTSLDGTPSNEEILKNQLCGFAVRFCQYGLNRCIHLCQHNLLQHMNDCYILWCISYFLPFSALPCVTYSNVRNNLSAMLVSHLVFASFNTWEGFTMSANDASADSKSNILFRRLYLLVASLRQILTTTQKFTEKHLGEDERESINNFVKFLSQLEDLRKLYLLLLRKFCPKNESIQYLRALIVSNDELLRIITSGRAYAIPGIERFNCKEHLGQLATRQILLTYNELLQKFSSNSREENEAVFTLMYHTAIDLNNYKLVYQLSILDTFANLWEQGAKNCISQSSWDFMDHIVAVFAQDSLEEPDMVLEHMADTPNKKRKYEETLDDLSEDESSPCKKSFIAEGGLYIPAFLDEEEEETTEVEHVTDSVNNCIQALTIKGYKPQICNLQTLLLETCYAKLDCPKTEIVEPLVWLNHIQMKSVPLFAFTQADELAMNDAHFQHILQQLGMHSAGDSQQHLYPSIPAFWTAEMCYNAAKMLGEINFNKLRFAISPEGELCPEFVEMQGQSMTYDPSQGEEHDLEVLPEEKPSTSRISSQISSFPKNMWLSIIQQLNAERAGTA